MDIEKVCSNVCDLTIHTGKFIKKESARFNTDKIETKGLHDYVSYVDRAAEKMLVKGLKKILPGAGFLTEEKTVENKQRSYTWVIDPVDGTTNFIHGVPCYSTSIALMCDGKIILGVVNEINMEECFYAREGSDAFLNGKKINVSRSSSLNDALLATGFPFYDYSRLAGYMDLLVYFLKNSHGVRRMGSAAVDLAYVACGRFEGFYEYGLSPWDVAAGAFIVERAGGKVSDFNGGRNFIFGKEIIASNAKIHKEFVRVVKKHL